MTQNKAMVIRMIQIKMSFVIQMYKKYTEMMIQI